MRKIFSLLLSVTLLASLICPQTSYAATGQNEDYSNYDIIKEIAYAYDRQGAQILYDQYNARRSIYASPEDATSQRTIFLDCSSYVNSCYREAFGVNIMPYEILPGTTGTSPSTVYYDTYAKNNQEAKDVIGYWEPQTYTSDDAKSELVDWIRNNIEIGDIVTYRHGASSGTKGHVYMYLGDNTFIHCRGAGSFTVNESNPALSYDNDSSEITSKGTIETISFATIFENTTHSRYIFKATTSDTVWSFSILRPTARELTPTRESINRMKVAGLSMEKTSSVWENTSVKTGDTLTYTITLENTNKTELVGITISDTLPSGTEFVSGDDGVSINGNSVSWQGNVPASSTINVNYSVKITADVPGTLIKSNATYVSGVKLGNITHSVSGLDSIHYALIADGAIRRAKEAKTYGNGIELANDIYSAYGITLFKDYVMPSNVLDDLIDTTNRTVYTTTDISKMIAPNLYGGLDIRYGRLYLPSENDRTNLPKEEHLSVGDVIIADWSGGGDVYIYAGSKRLVTVDNGICKTLTIGDNIYGKGQDNIIISLLGYDRFAVLRPTMTMSAINIEVSSIKITTPPTKLTYTSNETFNPSGMVVEAVMADGTTQEIVGYTVSPSTLSDRPDFVTIEFGGLTTTQNITVNLQISNVCEVAAMSVGTNVAVEGIVVGAGKESPNDNEEMYIKDLNTDAIIAVRDIPSSYGSYPSYGYEKGDRIVFEATIKQETTSNYADVSPYKPYCAKKFLSFSSSNGSKASTIISRNFEISYKFDNVTTLNTWEEMQNFFKSSKLKPYTYVKLTGDMYMHLYYASSDKSNNFRIHKNPSAAKADDIKITNAPIVLKEDMMNYNIGENWKDLFNSELKNATTSYPGTSVTGKEFYAIACGGKYNNNQLVILDESWIYDSDFKILKASDNKETVTINAPTAGTYSIMFADYENNRLQNIDIVPVPVAENSLGRISIEKTDKSFTLDSGDKILLWDSISNPTPKCTEFIIQ